ncbi:hypothetical protein [Neotabrizicola shimadae]|uniref:Uncharacterized protein n=1 Tax=Neotabrizicola shimadae TaxID=2807096 RepID=A0A8G0ZRF2_9RHOB|nr:hypothetical protein [Neotabrizicola shimadae]QYZ68135.1 hypothetical protein JO391_09990 [Neotabrizicola shimadae]
MRRAALTALLALCAAPAAAQSVFDRAAGLYGDAKDPALSCTANPHRLSFIDSPPHAFFTWAEPTPDAQGRMRSVDRYDLEGATDTTLLLELEGSPERSAEGQRPVWILRLSTDGYCWGRQDWPLIRCERPQVRCDQPVS